MGTSIRQPYVPVAYGHDEGDEFQLSVFVRGELVIVDGLSHTFTVRVPADTNSIELEANQAGINVQPLRGTLVAMPVSEKVSFDLTGKRTQFNTNVDFEVSGQQQRSVVFLVDKMKA